jgi:DNA helicase-4
VGDDWQSIFRFTGSDIGLTKHFGKCFGATAISALDLTFRFNNKIGEVSSRFVLKNPEQVEKSIGSLNQLHEPAISLVRTQDKQKGLLLALDAIKQRARSLLPAIEFQQRGGSPFFAIARRSVHV